MPSLHRNDEAKTELCVTVSESLSLEFFRHRGLGAACIRAVALAFSRRPMSTQEPVFLRRRTGEGHFSLERR